MQEKTIRIQMQKWWYILNAKNSVSVSHEETFKFKFKQEKICLQSIMFIQKKNSM